MLCQAGVPDGHHLSQCVETATLLPVVLFAQVMWGEPSVCPGEVFTPSARAETEAPMTRRSPLPPSCPNGGLPLEHRPRTLGSALIRLWPSGVEASHGTRHYMRRCPRSGSDTGAGAAGLRPGSVRRTRLGRPRLFAIHLARPHGGGDVWHTVERMSQRLTVETVARWFKVPVRMVYGDPRCRRAFRLYRQRRG